MRLIETRLDSMQQGPDPSLHSLFTPSEENAVRKVLVQFAGALCLSLPIAMPAFAADMTQQDKMKMCNKDATGKKGDERKAFMSTCLKG